MISKGYILPNGMEIDLMGHPEINGSVHLYYAKEYVKKLKKKNLKFYNAFRTFCWNWDPQFSRSAIECEFLIRYLKWIEVGIYSNGHKYLTVAYFSNQEWLYHSGYRYKTISNYEDLGYEIIRIPEISDKGFKKPPANWMV